jgi:citrate lyase subunit beta/citryl-CoA lyase
LLPALRPATFTLAAAASFAYLSRGPQRENAMQIRPRRSVLYMPGSNARALEKAKSIAADGLILDLEDAVAPEAKELARDQVCRAVAGGGYGRRELVIRINALETAWGQADLAAAIEAAPDAILLPKTSSAADVLAITQTLQDAGAAGKTRLWAMIETPLAILNLAEIAATSAQAGARLDCFVLGTNDLVKETRADLMAGRRPALYWLSAAVVAARAYGLDVLDGVYNDFRDADGFYRECRDGRALGFDGKTLIHPDQVADANRVFAPAEADLALARQIIAAFERSENKGRGVVAVEGRMVELMHAKMAERTVAIAAAIAALGATP